MNTKDQVILITGGGKGIGREIAKLAAANRNMVIITGRTERPLQDTVRQIQEQGGQAAYHIGDITVAQDCERIVQAVAETYGRLDVLINNAGMSMRGSFAETTLELFEKIMAINFMGAVNMSKYALPHILAAQGSIIFISSIAGMKGLPGTAPYSTAKMALTGFSESLRCELSTKNVHIGIVYVGLTENDREKKVYTADGRLIDIPRRKNHDTQLGVARSVMKCLARRKNTMVLTPLGKAAKLMYQVFPGLSNKILSKFTRFQKQEI